jgi:hypothetical protein
MVKKYFVLFISFSLTSCVTLFSSKTYNLKIQSTTNSKVKVYDKVYQLPATVEVFRSKEDLKISVISDTLAQEINIKSKIDPFYWYGNLPVYYLGYFIDLPSKKKFYYGDEINLEKKDSLKQTFMYTSKTLNIFSNASVLKDPPKKGNLKIAVSVPVFVNHSFIPENQFRRNYIGSLGLSLGLDYYYSKNKFLNINVTSYLYTQDNNDFSSKGYSEASSADITLTNNHNFKRISLGYGLSYAKYDWYELKYATLEDVKSQNALIIKNYNVVGLVFSAYYQIIKNFHVGFVYKPSFYRPSLAEKFNYEHTIYFDLVYKLDIF